MKKFTSKIVAFALAFAMVFACGADVYAAAPVGDPVSANTVQENIPDDQASAPEVSYVALASRNLTEGDDQAVLVGIDTTGITNAIVTLSKVGGSAKDYSATVIDGEGIAFVIPASELGVGEYKIDDIKIVSDDAEVSLPLADMNMSDISFTVAEATLSTEEDMSGIVNIDSVDPAAIGSAVQNALASQNTAGDVLSPELHNGKYVVVIDPGHDGTHAGANKNGLAEERLTLVIAQALYNELVQYSGVEVYMTRTGAACPWGYPAGAAGNKSCLESRVAFAASKQADLFVSIHLNSQDGGNSLNGVEVWIPNSPSGGTAINSAGASVGSQIQSRIAALGLRNRGLKSSASTDYPGEDRLSVIRNSKRAGIVGIIVEHAFVSNPSDAAFLSNPANLTALGVADATGIASYYGLRKGAAVDREKVEAFVKRLYVECLDRQPDAEGFNAWVEALCNGTGNGANVAAGFFFSDEFKNRGLSNEEYVEKLYRVLMGRGSDAGGKASWVDILNKCGGRKGVFKGFVYSPEYAMICQDAGISVGTYEPGGRDRNLSLAMFVGRLYTKALGRGYDETGMDAWCEAIGTGQGTIDQVSTNGFFHSEEFINKNLSNEDYVTVLYHTFFDREPDASGKAAWVKALNEGASRDQVLWGFANSVEFAQLKASFGL